MAGARAAALASLGMAAAAAAPHIVPVHMHLEDRPPHSPLLELRGGGHDVPAGGAVFPTAIYWATVQIGTPPRDFAVGVDSGSGHLFVEGKGCSGCSTSPPNIAYDPAASSTSRKTFPGFFAHTYKTCDMRNPGATCTLRGDTYADQVSLAGLGPVEVKFGAITGQSANFDTKKVVGGLMGLQNGEKGQDVLATLVAAGKCENVWGICMSQGRVSNGTLTVGGVDPRLAIGDIKYVKDSGLFNHGVDVKGISVNGRHAETSGQTAVLDSGTNILLLPVEVHKAVQQAMCADNGLAHCADLWSNQCFTLSQAEYSRYPDLVIELDGVSLEMTREDYLLLGSPLASAAGQRCLAIRDGGDAGFIIGATTMRKHYTIFDFSNGRIGFGKVNTDTCGSVGASVTSAPALYI